MKNLITLITAAFLVNASFGQVVFQSDLSSWSGGNPTDFFGSKTSIASSNVTEVTTGAIHGTSYANLVSSSSSHKRFTTQAVTVVPGTKYSIKMWLKTVPGDTTSVRVSLYDLTNSTYTSYTPYQDLTDTVFTMYEDSVIAPAGCTSLEFIISSRYSDVLGFGLDSVSISGPMAPPPALSQIDLPVTFEDTTVDYTMTDFGGNASMLMTDPTSATNKVMRVIKTTGAQTWAGTTISTASGFASAIPFTANDTLMTVKVWSAAAGKTVRLKVEDASNGAINCETDAVTTVAGGWDTLTFNFASPAGAPLNTANTYNMASIFFDFNTAGAQDTFYFDDVMFVTSPPPALSQIDLPVTFEDTTVDYTMTDFGGNASMLMTDPTSATNKVMRVIKTTGAQTWAGTTISTASGFASAIPFTANDTLMTVKVWSAAAGKTVRLKVEDASNGAINCETDAVTTVAGGWDTLTFNFASPAGAPLNTANTYNMASIFFDFNTAGAQDTFYFDDVMFVTSPPPALSQIDLPVTFEDTTVDYTMTDFGGNASMLMTDPTSATNKVMRVIKTTGAQTWAGTTISTASGFASAIPFTANDTLMTVKVWSAAAGKTVRLKVEDASNGAINCETDAVTTVAGGWDTLTFNFASPAGAPLNTANTYNMASIFFDFNTAGAQDTFYFDDVMFVTSPPPALSQIDLPVTFEDTTVDYTMTDFGGNASMLMTDPTSATNKVMRVIKTTGAQTWAGTTISTASGFASAIPFTANDTLMTVKVWSAAAGKTVRLKVEDASNGAINCETDAVTTVAGGWDTLTFNFASPAGAPLNTANTYNMASIFFDFNTAGAQDTFYFDDVMFVTSPPPALSQIDLPVTFEDTTVDYTMTDFGGNASMLMTDPTSATNKVMRVIKTTGAQTWAGTTISTASGFASAIPFTANDTLMTVKVWSAAAGKTVRLKVEDASNGAINCETDAVTTVAGGWDTLTFNFASPAGAPLNTANTYNMASIFFDFNTAGAQDTFYFDDVMFVTSPPPALSQIDLPVTFEDTTVDYTMTDFGGNASMLMTDPTSATNKVMRVIKTTGAQTWAGTTISTASGFASAIPFTANDTLMTVKVWSAAAGKTVRLKVEDASNGAINCETDAVTTVAGGWDTLTFNFASPAGAPLNTANTYNMASIFFDFNTAGAQDTFYFDDVMFVTSPPPALSQIDLPVTFEDTTVDYTMTDFGGNASMLMTDPTSATNKVMRVIKTTGAQTWAGTTISTASGFATAIPFTAIDQKMTVRVWSAAAGTPVRLKVEDATAPTITCETEALTVTAGGWDTLTFDFGSPATGTAALNIANTYDKASIFMDFNTAGAQDTFYFDDVMFVTSPPPALSQIDLPVTFDDTTVDYTMTDFGGNASLLMTDPTSATNKVMRVIKTTGAQTWAGTTIGTASGFATAIPFTAIDQKMTVRVWSAAAGTPVRLKVEDATAPTISCETEALTVTAGGWDTLTFDFGSPATGTAALNIANTYDKASIFMDFNTAGAQDTFYFDDVMFVTSPPPALSQIDLPVTFDDTTVDYTMTDFGGNASLLMTDPTSATNKVMRVIKTTGAQTWAGTTIGTASGFATAIPFTAIDQKMTVRVWSAAAGTPVRLKVEDATAPTITCETEALTVTAGGWDTLTFDFGSPATGTAALNIANTYDKASIFMDFNTAGAQDTFYFDDVMFVTSPPPALSQIDLPVTFDDTTVDYTMTDFGGNASLLMTDPTSATNKVMRVIKTTGAQTWAGTTIGTASGFATAIPFTAIDQKMTVRVWSAAAGTPVRLKVEDATAPTISCETEALTVTAGGWDTLTFDFGSPATGTAALNIANTYDKASIFMDFNTAGAQDTFYFDDVMFVTSPPPALSQIDLPVTFDDTTVDYTMTDFGGNASLLMTDPTSATNKVMRVIKTTGAQTWAGTTIGTASGFATAIPFTAIDQKMTVRVWSAAAGTPVRLKVEDATAPTITCETEALTVTAGGWDTLTFDFGSPATGTAALNIANTYDKASIFMDFNTAGAQDTFYFDDVMFVTSPPPALSQIDLPVTFDDTTVDYTMTDFGGNASLLMTDPTSATNKVMRVIKTTGAQTWAGTTIGTASGFATAIPFTAIDQKMTVRVWSAAAGTPVRLKVEDATAPTISCETEALTVTAGGWDTLTFDFGSPATGTAALNIANTYDKASIFMDFNTAGAQDTFYFDDVMFVTSPPPALSQIDLPVTFDDTTVDYTMTDFGGNASLLMTDPTSATNKVMRVIKTAGAQTWAGTSICTPIGMASSVPFTSTDTRISVRVWSPYAGIPIRLKVENASNSLQTCETEDTTTVIGWNNLMFDFNNPASGTAALNTAFTFNMASIFFDFNTAGALDTFYFDDVMFEPGISSIDEIVETKLSVYPNPTSNQWLVSSPNQDILRIEVYDLKGTLIITSNPTSKIVEVDGSSLNKGIYLLRTFTAAGISTSKIVKK